jgi:hypothetical protein
MKPIMQAALEIQSKYDRLLFFAQCAALPSLTDAQLQKFKTMDKNMYEKIMAARKLLKEIGEA